MSDKLLWNKEKMEHFIKWSFFFGFNVIILCAFDFVFLSHTCGGEQKTYVGEKRENCQHDTLIRWL